MKKETLDQLHAASEKLREAVELYSGTKNVIVAWAIVNHSDNQCASSITLGEEVTHEWLARMIFNLNGRAYNMLNFKE